MIAMWAPQPDLQTVIDSLQHPLARLIASYLRKSIGCQVKLGSIHSHFAGQCGQRELGDALRELQSIGLVEYCESCGCLVSQTTKHEGQCHHGA